MKIGFVGHSFVFEQERVKELVKELVKEELRKSQMGEERLICYVGAKGDFDLICAKACKELKLEQGGIEVVYVTPYISLSEQEKIKELQKCGLCDSSLYPPIESTPIKFAISKRNEWMMENSDIIIAYVEHNYGGAYKSLCYAKRKGKRIVNLCDLL